MVYNPFYMVLDLICKYFVEDFCIYIHKGYWSVVPFSCDAFVSFGVRVILDSVNDLESVPSSSIFWMSL